MEDQTEMKNYTIVYVGKFASLSQADEVADGISQDADLAILVVRESTDEEIQGFNQDYLDAMTSPPRDSRYGPYGGALSPPTKES